MSARCQRKVFVLTWQEPVVGQMALPGVSGCEGKTRLVWEMGGNRICDLVLADEEDKGDDVET